MAEEILYEEQIGDQEGDPKDPLGLRKRLSQKKDPLGLRQKYTQAPPEKKASAIPTIDWSKPVFEKMATESTSIQPSVTVQKAEAAQYKPTQTVLGKFIKEISGAQEKVYKELTENDDVLESIVRNERAYTAQRQQMDEYLASPRSDMPSVQNPALQVDSRIPKDIKPQDLPVLPEDINREKIKVAGDELRARNVLEEVARKKPQKKNEIQSAIYQLDMANVIQQDPEGGKRVIKAQDNAAKLEKGELVYDWRQGRLYKPENIVESAITGWKHKTQLFEDYDKFKKTENNAAIAMDLDARRNEIDPDEPIPIPEGKLGELGSMIGGTPAKALIGGAVGGLVGPEGAVAAGSIIGGREFAKLQYAQTFQTVYYQLRDEGMDEYGAVEEARKQANEAAEVGFLTGAAMGLVGARIGMKPLPKVALNEGFRKAVVGSLKNVGSALGKATKEGLALGGIAAGGQRYLNQLAKDAGIDRDLDEGAAESIESMLLFTLSMAAAVKGSKAFSPKTYKTILNGLSKADEGYINKTLQEWVDSGQITLEQATQTKDNIASFKKEDATIPANIAPEARVDILEKIKKRGSLEQQLETLDKAYHPEIKEKIKAIDEQITELSRNKIKVSAEENKVNNLINEAIEEGKIPGIMADIAKQDADGFMKMVADQALGRQESGVMSDLGNAEYVMRQQYGDAIVDKALEMHPLTKKESSITVIRPEERTQPTETITIPPRESGVPEFNISFEKGKVKGDLIEGKELISDGSEHTVYRDGDTVIKVGEPYNAPETFNQRIEDARIISDVLGDGSLELIGTYKSKNGTDNPIFRQKYIEGEKATQEQIDAFMESKGFKKKNAGWESEEYRFTDIDSDNAILDKDGQVHIIDAAVKKLKTEIDAIPVESTTEVSLGETPINRGEMVEGIPKSEEFTRTQEEGKITGEGPEMTGITHAELDKLADEFGFETYQKDPETIAQWDTQARERLQNDPKALDKLFTKLRNGIGIDKVETRMALQYVADLKAKINKNPTEELLNQLKRTKDLIAISSREKGKELRALQGLQPVEESLSDFLINDMEANKAPLTDQQKAKATEQYEAINNAKEKFEAAAAQSKEKATETKAQEEINRVKKETKKDTKKDYKKERSEIISDIRAKLKKARGETSVVAVPYAKELIAIAPDVAKLVKNLVEQGIDQLPDLIKAVHNEVKDLIDGITEKDVHNIIAGEYNTPKPKRSAVAEKVFDLQTEAKLINQLEALENGVEPKSETKRKERNRKIEALRKQLKEHDLTKLAEYKQRVKRQIEELKQQLAKGDFAKEEPEPIKLDEEAMKARDELLRLRDERAIYKLKLEYESRPAWQKGLDIGAQALRTGKVLKSSFDVSFLGRQTIVGTVKQLFALPFKRKDGKWSFTGFEQQQQLRKQVADMYRSFGSETNYRRIMGDIKDSPRFEDAQKAGLNLSDPNSPLSQYREEEFQKSFAEYIPIVKQGVKASNRAASALSNQQKWDIYNQFVEGFEAKGMTFRNSPDAYKEAAKYANQLVGRGFLGQKLEMANAVTSPILWSLRLQVSRLQLLTKFMNPNFYTKVPPEIRVAYIKDMAKFIGTGIGILSLASAAGIEVELDPRSADFGTMKVGNTRYDIWGGFKQYVVLFSRLFSGSTKKSSGEIEQLREVFADDIKFGESTRADVAGRFLRTKLTPEVGLGIDLLSGQGFDKKPITPGKAALEFITPLLYKDFTEALKDGGLDKALITTVLTVHGIGAQTYGEGEVKSSKKPSRTNKRREPINKRSKSN